MKRISLKEMLAMAAIVATSSVAYAAPEASITLTWYQGQDLDPQENIYSIETEWSESVNADTEQVLTLNRIVDGSEEPVMSGKFVRFIDGATTTWSIQLEDLIDVPGMYNLTIPEGTLYNGESYDASLSANVLTTLDFLVKEPEGGDIDYKYSLIKAEPADGEDVTSISVVKTYWDGPVAQAGIGSGMVRLSNSAGMPLQTVDLIPDEADYSLFTATFTEVTEPGEYMVIIPEGIITCDGDAASPEVVLNYTIGGSSDVTDELKITKVLPADGSTVTELSRVQTTWNINVEANFGDSVPVMKDGETVGEAVLAYDNTTAYNEILLSINPAIIESGVYTIIIPAGTVKDSKGTVGNAEITLTYTVGEGGGNTPGDDSDITYDFNPIDVSPKNGSTIDNIVDMGKGDLESINISFSDAPYVKEGFEFVFTNEEGTKFYSSKPSLEKEDETVNYYIFNLDGHSIILGLENIPSGTYTLTVPKGVIGNKAWATSGYTAGSSNDEFTYTWNYIAKNVVDVPKEIQEAPLELTVATVTLPNGDVVNLLDGDPGLAILPVGAEFTFATNKDEYAQALYLDILDDNSGESLWTIWTTPSKDPAIPSIGMKGEDGLFHFVKGGFDIPMYTNNKYTLSVKAYVEFEVPAAQRIYLQDTEIEIKGLTPAEAYSDVEILGVTPEVGTVFDNPDQRSFTVTYSAPVTIDEAQSGYVVAYMGIQPFENITSNDDKTKWTFTLPESELYECKGGDIACNVVANDMEGRRVFPKYNGSEYNIDSYGNGYQQFVFNSYLGCPEVTVEPGAGTVKELYTFEFSCPDAVGEAIGVQGIDTEGNAINIVVIDSEGNEVAMVDRNDMVQIDNKGQVVSEDSEDFEITVVKLIMHLNNAVTTTGDYTLVIPAGYFQTGTQFDAFGNRPQEIKYTVDPTTGVAAVAGEGADVAVVAGKIVVAGAEGAVEVYAVNGAKVASVAAEEGNAVVALEKGVYVVVVNGKSVKVVL